MQITQVDIRRYASLKSSRRTIASVSSYRLTEIDLKKIPAVDINSLSEYYLGCTLHEGCAGHICRTKEKFLIMPHKYPSIQSLIPNKYAKYAQDLFITPTKAQYEQYLINIKHDLMGKRGVMRNDGMGGRIDGSLRSVVIPNWNMEINEIALYSMVASTMKVIAPEYVYIDNQYIDTGRFYQRSIKAGDYVIVVRPPSLWKGNVQPMKVIIWDRPCIGLHPSKCADYHADFDGDELQIYPIYIPKSIDEAKSWINPSPDQFTIDRIPRHYWHLHELPPNPEVHDEKYIHGGVDKNMKWNGVENVRQEFMKYSTISMMEIKNGYMPNKYEIMCRMKQTEISLMRDSLKSNPSIEEFYEASISGMKDVITQQNAQSPIGAMSRAAKNSLSDFYIMDNYVTTKLIDGSIYCMELPSYCLYGNPAIRAISVFCAAAQQVALDAHRVRPGSLQIPDLINSFMKGGGEAIIITLKTRLINVEWEWSNNIYLVSDADTRACPHDLIATTSVTLARKCDMSVSVQVLSRGIKILAEYYKLNIDICEIEALAFVMCTLHTSDMPPLTSPDGCKLSAAKWITKILTINLGLMKKLKDNYSQWEEVDNMIDCSLFGNFRRIRSISEVDK